MTVQDHTYAIGGNSRSEHFGAPDAIAAHLAGDTCEACNTYNMLKLTRELWALEPDEAAYFDFYESALLNHLLGAQDPHSAHGHITYFTPLSPGGATGDGIPAGESSRLTVAVTAGGEAAPEFALRVRIPSWAAGASISVNEEEEVVSPPAGSYAELSARAWADGDVIDISLPMALRTVAANDDPQVAAAAYGPVVLCGNYGEGTLAGVPELDVESITRQEGGLKFRGKSGDQVVDLVPFYEAHGFNYNVYWKI
ncbi:unnamed protein product [Parascedosporium putredinis]|uniref:Uncharacterized protein n=1 Tax=Parascedosporium putredinis TaxID=1442378 RepID=A0A9P1H245_9PEZI|nr:unnamed protein product [Parascedosporium putredinis]CAI7993640.1 unnamed protein product [Parascedosporium putredinis]